MEQRKMKNRRLNLLDGSYRARSKGVSCVKSSQANSPEALPLQVSP